MNQLLERYLWFVKKIFPEKASGTSVIGLDIGVSSCKMVELEKSGNEYHLLSWVVEPVANGDMARTIRTLVDKFPHPTPTLSTAVSGKGTLIRCISVPRMSVEDFKKSLAIEADKYFPFAQDQVYTDCYILDPERQDKKMLALVAASKKEIIDARAKLFSELGLHADYIGLNAIALGNLVVGLGAEEFSKKKGQAGAEASSVVAILDMGEVFSTLIIFVEGLPRFTRDIFVGGQDFTKRISHALQISLPEAERLKCHPHEKSIEVINACESTFLNLTSEIRMSFDYFTTEDNLPVNTLILTGGGLNLKGLTDYFSKNFDVPLSSWDPLVRVKVADGLSLDELKRNANRLWIALGLAISNYD